MNENAILIAKEDLEDDVLFLNHMLEKVKTLENETEIEIANKIIERRKKAIEEDKKVLQHLVDKNTTRFIKKLGKLTEGTSKHEELMTIRLKMMDVDTPDFQRVEFALVDNGYIKVHMFTVKGKESAFVKLTSKGIDLYNIVK